MTSSCGLGLENVFIKIPRVKLKTRLFYEIIIRGKKEKQNALYEILFDETGNLIKELKFAPINNDNLEF